jgi:2-polyprenyl-3-methyl-5-hydroxy-6-metoxy-1,4-benzoquinol methylase
MNWARLRHFPWADTRARFVARAPRGARLLDLGSSDGETLRHIAELRPDLKLFSVDIAGAPASYPAGCTFHRANLERDRLPWPDGSMDRITCMHLVEHLNDLTALLRECTRLIKLGSEIYFETPHPKTLALPSPRGAAAGTFTVNFYDDPTHVRLVRMEELAAALQGLGFEIRQSGISRNWLFAAAYPLFLFLPSSRKKFTARVHWLGWSAYLIGRRIS